MKKDYTKYLAATVGVIVTTAVVAGATYAYQGDGENNKLKGPRFNTEQHEEMVGAIDNKDYATWKELMGDSPITEKITEENFDKFVEARQLMVDGKYEEAKVLREELGLQNKEGFKKGWNGMHKGEEFNKENFTAVKEAIANNDYNAWKNAWQELKGDDIMAEKITAENFSKLAESHNLMQEGKFEEAKQIREELGLNFGRGGMGRFQKTQQ